MNKKKSPRHFYLEMKFIKFDFNIHVSNKLNLLLAKRLSSFQDKCWI